MFFEVLSVTYHSPITIGFLTYGQGQAELLLEDSCRNGRASSCGRTSNRGRHA